MTSLITSFIKRRTHGLNETVQPAAASFETDRIHILTIALYEFSDLQRVGKRIQKEEEEETKT